MKAICPTCQNEFEASKYRRARYCSVPCHKHRLRDPAVAQAHFWSRVNKEAPNGCWEWTAARDKWGYGDLNYMGKHVQPHRQAWKFLHGEPGELDVLHKCNNPPCCNPDHLYLGTDLENAADRVRAGNHPHGEKAYNAKLNEEKVREIRRMRAEDGTPYHKIASKFGVNYSTARYICIGRNWKHVP